VAHIVPLDSGAPDSETTRSPHQMSFTSPRCAPTSTSVFPSDFEYGNDSQTSYLSTPSSNIPQQKPGFELKHSESP
ncbi:hypothetical protein PENARI_c102G07735, partial [Penicillium arizonense]